MQPLSTQQKIFLKFVMKISFFCSWIKDKDKYIEEVRSILIALPFHFYRVHKLKQFKETLTIHGWVHRGRILKWFGTSSGQLPLLPEFCPQPIHVQIHVHTQANKHTDGRTIGFNFQHECCCMLLWLNINEYLLLDI